MSDKKRSNVCRKNKGAKSYSELLLFRIKENRYLHNTVLNSSLDFQYGCIAHVHVVYIHEVHSSYHRFLHNSVVR